MNPGDLDVTKAIGGVVAAIAALGALGTAAFGLVDATKAFEGGISNIGFSLLLRALAPFAPALQRAVGDYRWQDIVRAHWVNGRARADQKAIVKSLIRLGLAPDIARGMAAAGHVDPAALEAASGRLLTGQPLSELDVNVLGRFDASVEAHIDAAFDLADERYRSVSRFVAGVIAIVLGMFAAWLLGQPAGAGFLAGVLAVPMAPIAKDLASSLTSAARAVKSVRPLS